MKANDKLAGVAYLMYGFSRQKQFRRHVGLSSMQRSVNFGPRS